jgi:hypothetical protein
VLCATKSWISGWEVIIEQYLREFIMSRMIDEFLICSVLFQVYDWNLARTAILGVCVASEVPLSLTCKNQKLIYYYHPGSMRGRPISPLNIRQICSFMRKCRSIEIH